MPSPLTTIRLLFHPTIDALVPSSIPFSLRLRLLLFQPIAFLIYTLNCGLYHLPWTRKPYTEHTILLSDGRTVRALVFFPPSRPHDVGSTESTTTAQLRPLHFTVHAGGFIGGLPESTATYCLHLASATGAVIVSLSYRIAPRHVFPAGVDDVRDAIRAVRRDNSLLDAWRADPALWSVSGFSAGANLALAGSLTAEDKERPLASVTMYAPLDLYTPPWEKRPPAHIKLPAFDPMRPLLPLFDSYAVVARLDPPDNPRLSPAFAERRMLPRNMLLVVPEIDIVVDEQMRFAEEMRKGGEGRVEVLELKGMPHGLVELPTLTRSIKDAKERAFKAAADFLNEVNRDYGYVAGKYKQ